MRQQHGSRATLKTVLSIANIIQDEEDKWNGKGNHRARIVEWRQRIVEVAGKLKVHSKYTWYTSIVD
jgi:hypothetical protein